VETIDLGDDQLKPAESTKNVTGAAISQGTQGAAKRGLAQGANAEAYTKDEEALVEERLKKLGYL
jgi:hypothetical protein